MMLPVVVTRLAFVATLFRSQTALRLENLALRHQLAVYTHTVTRPRLLLDYFSYYHRWRTHQSLAMDCPEPRTIKPSESGRVMAVPEVGGLQHHYAR
jgi:hypothetical protein